MPAGEGMEVDRTVAESPFSVRGLEGYKRGKKQDSHTHTFLSGLRNNMNC